MEEEEKEGEQVQVTEAERAVAMIYIIDGIIERYEYTQIELSTLLYFKQTLINNLPELRANPIEETEEEVLFPPMKSTTMVEVLKAKEMSLYG